MPALILPFDGHSPSIDASAWVAPNSTLIGRVRIGADSSVYYGAVVRADMDSVTIGAGSNLQDNVSVHCDTDVPTIVGDRVSVGHSAVLHGCTVEDDCLIGMSATLLNGSVIGRGSLVAAGAVVLEGTVIPPGSLVAGVPGKVRRAITDDELEHIRQNAEHYLALTAVHREL